MKFYKCLHCGQIVTKEIDKNVNISCCGENMKELVANNSDGANEKHVPVVSINSNIVSVSIGEVEHPMIEAHYIVFIAIETNKGHQIKYLKPNEKPYAEFVLSSGEEFIRAYEYCNLHSLWSN